MFWKVKKIEGCNLVPEYCHVVVFEGDETEQWVQAGDTRECHPIGFTLAQANMVASVLNDQIEKTEASLRLNTFNVKPTKEIN